MAAITEEKMNNQPGVVCYFVPNYVYKSGDTTLKVPYLKFGSMKFIVLQLFNDFLIF